MQTFVEEVIEQQGLEVSLLLVSLCDVAEENTLEVEQLTVVVASNDLANLDDASTTPHTGNTSIVQVPFLLK
jgi:hypothetical protein